MADVGIGPLPVGFGTSGYLEWPTIVIALTRAFLGTHLVKLPASGLLARVLRDSGLALNFRVGVTLQEPCLANLGL